MMEKRIETVFAEVLHTPWQWPQAVIEEGDFTGRETPEGMVTRKDSCFTPDAAGQMAWAPRGAWRPAPKDADDIKTYGDPRVIRRATGSVPVGMDADTPPWETVRQLHFYLEEENWLEVRRFYSKYGPLGDPEGREMAMSNCERLGWAKAALGWFQALTVITAHVQEGRAEHLREKYFGEPREVSAAEAEKPLHLWGPHEQAENPYRYSIYWDWTTGPDGVRRAPSTDAELYAAAWDAVSSSVEEELAEIPLTPTKRDFVDSKFPQLQWGFWVDGVLQAAFLAWYFHIFAPFRVATCQREGCDGPVLGRQRKYCSLKCGNRSRVANSPKRKKRGG
jgi:hypothetical protein